MSGHSHWSGIKHKKEITDQKRGKVFSKLLNAVSIAGRQEPNPQFNPRLRTAIEKAQQYNVPLENIERALKRAAEDKNLEELLVGAYGPEGSALLIEIITDNKNRALSEIKKILNEYQAKFCEPENTLWAFENVQGQWQAKFQQKISTAALEKIKNLVQELENLEETQGIYGNF